MTLLVAPGALIRRHGGASRPAPLAPVVVLGPNPSRHQPPDSQAPASQPSEPDDAA